MHHADYDESSGRLFRALITDEVQVQVGGVWWVYRHKVPIRNVSRFFQFAFARKPRSRTSRPAEDPFTCCQVHSERFGIVTSEIFQPARCLSPGSPEFAIWTQEERMWYNRYILNTGGRNSPPGWNLNSSIVPHRMVHKFWLQVL